MSILVPGAAAVLHVASLAEPEALRRPCHLYSCLCLLDRTCPCQCQTEVGLSWHTSNPSSHDQIFRCSHVWLVSPSPIFLSTTERTWLRQHVLVSINGLNAYVGGCAANLCCATSSSCRVVCISPCIRIITIRRITRTKLNNETCRCQLHHGSKCKCVVDVLFLLALDPKKAVVMCCHNTHNKKAIVLYSCSVRVTLRRLSEFKQ